MAAVIASTVSVASYVQPTAQNVGNKMSLLKDNRVH